MAKNNNPQITAIQEANMLKCKPTQNPIPKDLQERVDKKLKMAIVRMLFNQPFFGTLVLRMKKMPADGWLSTMAVDGKYLYYNHQFVDILELEELVFVIEHETMHVAYDHFGRTGDRQKALFNAANDYVINGELINLRAGTFPVSVPGLYNSKYDKWPSEKVYEDLLKEQQKNPQNSDKMIQDLLDQMFDEHLDGSSSQNSDGDKESSQPPTACGPAKLSQSEKEQLKAEIRQAILTAAQMSQAGNLPAGISRMVENMTAPKLDWRSLLQSQLNSIVPADYSFMKVSRTGWHLDAIMPGMITDPMLDIVVALDMSGSIGQKEVAIFLSEIKGIMEQYPMYEIRIFCFDTKCYADRTFSSDSGESILTYEPKGGGGTDGNCIFEYMKEQNIHPLKLCVFTDGYVGNWGDENYCSTLWVIKGSREKPPFGTYAYYEDAE